jgi:hypothetical protein
MVVYVLKRGDTGIPFEPTLLQAGKPFALTDWSDFTFSMTKKGSTEKVITDATLDIIDPATSKLHHDWTNIEAGLPAGEYEVDITGLNPAGLPVTFPRREIPDEAYIRVVIVAGKND